MPPIEYSGEPHGYWLSNDTTPSPSIHAPLADIYHDTHLSNIHASRSVDANELIAASRHGNETFPPVPAARKNPRAEKNQSDATLKICCLGFFVIRRNGNIPVNIRSNSRPALLLRLLIASGPSGVEKQQAERMLGPGDDNPVTQNSIDSTLYRLRQLLQSERACRLDRGTIVLDAKQVSIDAWLFESEADALLLRLRRTAVNEAGEIAVRVERLLELYRGPFFANDSSLPVIAQTRDRLQGKFAQAVALAGDFWQEASRWDRAQQLYEQALTLDNLAEEIHRQIMRCHLAQGHFAEAVRAFSRCRELLESVLGVAPSEATTALYRHALLGRDNEPTN